MMSCKYALVPACSNSLRRPALQRSISVQAVNSPHFANNTKTSHGPVIKGADKGGQLADVLREFAAGILAFANDERQPFPGSWAAGGEENEIGFALLHRGSAWRELHTGGVGEQVAVQHGV